MSNKNQHTSSLDLNQMLLRTLDESNDCQRVQIVGADIKIDIDPSLVINSIKEGMSQLQINVDTNREEKKTEVIEKQVIVKEIEIREIHIPTIIKEIEIREIQVPVEVTKIVEIEKPIIIEKISFIEIDKTNTKETNALKIIAILEALLIIGLLMKTI